MIYYLAPNNQVHALDDRKFENLLPDGCKEIDKNLADEMVKKWEDLHINDKPIK